MALTLRVLRYLDSVPALCLDCRFGRQGGTLGRGSGNRMVLEDPDRFISRLHARIEFHDGAYWLLDLGGNPSLVNEKPVGIGRRVRLADGDVIHIGHYRLVAHVEPDAGADLVQPPLNAFDAASAAPGWPASSDDALAAQDILNDDDVIFNPSTVKAPSGGAACSGHDDHGPATGAPQPAAEPAQLPHEVSGDVVVRALLRGLGLPEQRTGLNAEQFAELAGTMLRAATRRVSRLDTKKTAARANNPLTACSDADAALMRMVGGAPHGTMGPAQAYAHAFDEIAAHERACLAGMRAALAGLLACFDPVAIEGRLGATTPMEKLFASRRKARLWDRMIALNAQLSSDAEEDFQRLFSQAFGRTYEQAHRSA